MLVLYYTMLDSEREKDRMTEIYVEHRLPLLKYALKITHNQAIAEDAVQNTFISIINYKEKYFSMECRDLRKSAVIIPESVICICSSQKSQKSECQ